MKNWIAFLHYCGIPEETGDRIYHPQILLRWRLHRAWWTISAIALYPAKVRAEFFFGKASIPRKTCIYSLIISVVSSINGGVSSLTSVNWRNHTDNRRMGIGADGNESTQRGDWKGEESVLYRPLFMNYAWFSVVFAINQGLKYGVYREKCREM